MTRLGRQEHLAKVAKILSSLKHTVQSELNLHFVCFFWSWLRVLPNALAFVRLFGVLVFVFANALAFVFLLISWLRILPNSRAFFVFVYGLGSVFADFPCKYLFFFGLGFDLL